MSLADSDVAAGATPTGRQLAPEALVDLASRAMGGSAMFANDELFAERENLISPESPQYQPYTFGHKGQVYDGWETRRRRGSGVDYAVIRLGIPGFVRQLVVDTAYFTGNYPPGVSVQGCAVEGYPTPEELESAEWNEILPESAVAGNTRNVFDAKGTGRFTHVRLCMHPDGGIARLRAYGEPVPDPRWLPTEFDLAALENGGMIAGCSNMFYSSPANLLAPGLARVMGEGWETSRRRDSDNDWVSVRLGAPGTVRWAELDTSHFKGNAPGEATLTGLVSGTGAAPDTGTWVELLPRTRLQPDTRHRFRTVADAEVSEVRLDIFPDGGLARLRLHGAPSDSGRAGLARRWYDALPDGHARAVLGAAGIGEQRAAELAAYRPLPAEAELPIALD